VAPARQCLDSKAGSDVGRCRRGPTPTNDARAGEVTPAPPGGSPVNFLDHVADIANILATTPELEPVK
jgi:hypothetical protein